MSNPWALTSMSIAAHIPGVLVAALTVVKFLYVIIFTCVNFSFATSVSAVVTLALLCVICYLCVLVLNKAFPWNVAVERLWDTPCLNVAYL